MQVAIIGGGAAGFFAALACKNFYPGYRVSIFEKSAKLLAKVKISGGGRCNVTHACYKNAELVKHYPRGEKFLKKGFGQFNTVNTVKWFRERGIKLKTEHDNRIFPETDRSQTIIDCLIYEAKNKGIQIHTQMPVTGIENHAGNFLIKFKNEQGIKADYVIIACGGKPKRKDFGWLEDSGHQIIEPVPSLFTFNIPDDPVRNLKGITIPNAIAKIEGSKLQQTGSLLITHWGMSGPLILKLSAWGARELNRLDYRFNLLINWCGQNENLVRTALQNQISQYSKKQLGNSNIFKLPGRLWEHLITKSKLESTEILANLSAKQLNRLVNTLTHDGYQVNGKSTYKEEFVTAGGIALSNVNPETMESKKIRGMFFAGEILDIDAITGGFNFQAAWTTGYIAGKLGQKHIDTI